MRKFIVIFLIGFLSSNVFSQKVIQMEYSNGVYKLPCHVNGAKLKMIFDTGASSVVISLSTAQYLYQNDYITDSDFRGFGQSQVADGRIVDNAIINLRDVEVAGIHIKDVNAVISSSLSSPLLFGQSAIQKLGKVSLQDGKLILLDVHSDKSYAVIYRGYYISKESLNKLLSQKANPYADYMNLRNDLRKDYFDSLNGHLEALFNNRAYFDSYGNIQRQVTVKAMGIQYDKNGRKGRRGQVIDVDTYVQSLFKGCADAIIKINKVDLNGVYIIE